MLRLMSAALVLFSLTFVAAQDDEKGPFRSGIPEKGVLAGPFDLFNLNGVGGAGRFHCAVCEFNLKPVVIVFTREPETGKETPLETLLEKLDGLGQKHKNDYLSNIAVYLSPKARTSVSAKDNAKVADGEDVEKAAALLVEEAAGRIELVKRLQPKAEKLKHVVVGIYPVEGPKGYAINPEAETTVLFYRNYRVLKNWAFKPGELTDEKAAEIADSVEKVMQEGKKAGGKKKL
ncbi:MAG: hypothetical protein K2X38_04300 [Gemmataceae bacterium]|nr:hypothetical protein [Gemmataceae bacterium]